MIFDCFTFNDELDVLDIRLNTLADVVDHFVIVESDHTHQGAEKPLTFFENRDRFDRFNIIPHHVDVMDQGCPITREFKQRRAIKYALAGIAKADDLIIVSDVDEIPRPEAVLKAAAMTGRVCMLTNLYYLYLNVLVMENWQAPQVVRFRELHDPQDLRNYEYKKSIANAGWHFSYLGGAEAVVRKIQSFSHNDFNRPEITDIAAMRERIANLTDPLDRGIELHLVELDDSFPPYVLANREKFAHLIR